jgi:predicted small metal-binding protein
MAKIVRCRHVGVDCDFEARGATEKEVLDQCVAREIGGGKAR